MTAGVSRFDGGRLWRGEEQEDGRIPEKRYGPVLIVCGESAGYVRRRYMERIWRR